MGGHIVLLVVFLVILIHLSAAQNFCAKVDFNAPTYKEFQDCKGRKLPLFVTKNYTTPGELKPNRPNGKYYLSNQFGFYTCGETTMKLSLNASSTIEAAIFLKSFDKSFFEIDVYDAAKNVLVSSFRNEGTKGWFNLKGAIKANIPNARVELYAYVTERSLLAIDYVYILNSAIKTPNCVAPAKPPGSAGAKASVVPWVLIVSICSGVALFIILLVGIICICKVHRRRIREAAAK